MPHRTVRDVMTADVVTVRRTTPFKEVAELLAVNWVGALPVTDESGRVLGLVSEADLLREESTQPEYPVRGAALPRLTEASAAARTETAEGLMTAPAFTISRQRSIVEAAREMERRHVKQLPVVDASGLLVGIISRSDLLRVFLRRDPAIRAEIEDEPQRTLLLDRDSVQVSVVDAVVVLRGRVERRALVPIVEQPLCRHRRRRLRAQRADQPRRCPGPWRFLDVVRASPGFWWCSDSMYLTMGATTAR